MHRLPPLSALRAFEAVSRHSTFRAAGRELHVTAAAVWQQVKSLEVHVGRRLLRRHHGGYVLTNDALAAVSDLRAGFERLSAAVQKLSQGQRSSLTVSAVPSLAELLLLPRLQEFEQRFADIDLLLHTSQQMVDLQSSGVDVALRFGSGVYAAAESVRLFSCEVFPVCSPQLIRSKGAIKTPSDLCNRPLLHLDWAPFQRPWPDWPAWLRAAGVADADPRKGLRFSDHALALQAALAGQGVVLATDVQTRDHLRHGRLIRLFKVSLETEFGYYFVTLKSRSSEPNIAAFRRWILSEVRRSGRE